MTKSRMIVEITKEDFSAKETIDVMVEIDSFEHQGYTVPTFNIISIEMRGEKLDRGPFFELLSYFIEEEVYHELKRKREGKD